jgi:hypothetical protein
MDDYAAFLSWKHDLFNDVRDYELSELTPDLVDEEIIFVLTTAKIYAEYQVWRAMYDRYQN